MYHSLTIGDRNTYNDFGLIPTARPVINPPEPNFSYLEVPGRSGVIDLSETLTGMLSYTNRTGSIEFFVTGKRNWSELYSELLAFLQGRFMRVVLEDDPLYYYEGRLTINAWKSNKNNSTVIVDYDLSPFKYETKNAVNGYLISNRNFQNSNAYFYPEMDTKTIEMIVTCSDAADLNVTALVGGIMYQCKKGVNILPILQTDGIGYIRVGGTGSVTINYRRGKL